jgi:hypothetical protein
MSGNFRASVRLATVGTLAVALTSCNYGFRGGGGFPSHVRTVFIAPIRNETVQFDIEQMVFRALTDRLPRSLGLRLAGEGVAHAIVRGSVVRYDNVAQNYRPGNVGSVDVLQHQVMVTLSLQIIDVRQNVILYEAQGITGRGEYQPDTQSEEVARRKAIDLLIQQVIDGAQSQW